MPLFDRLTWLQMGIFGQLRVSFWIAVAGVICLYAFFMTLAGIPPGQVAGVTAVMAVLTAIFALRNLRLARELADRGGDPRIRRARNRTRERRGF